MLIRILVVDDEAIVRNLVAGHLRSLGYLVETADHGLSALGLMGKAKIDIVVTDLSMPVLDGIGLLGRIREEYPLARVVVMTGFVTMENVLRCLRLGAFSFVCKPLDDLAPLEDAVGQAARVLTTWMKQLSNLNRLKPRGVDA